MYRYKLSVDSVKWFPIDEESFARATKRDFPYYQKNKENEDVHYAICPECNNPIQLIGLYNPPKHTSRPYARHCSQPVKGFPFFDPEAIRYCALSRQKKGPLSKQSLRPFDKKAQQILHLLIENFDQVVYMFGLFSGIRMSPNLAKDMIKQYGSDGCRYIGASPLNVPWGFVYMTDSQSLYGRIIHDVSLQKEIMERCADIYFENNQLKTKKFLKVKLWFIKHVQKITVDGSLYESFDMVINVGEKDIICQKIVFDHELFRSLLHVSDEKRPNKEKYVSLARETFAKIIPTGVLDASRKISPF